MVSSTFTDLVQHRKALMRAIAAQELMSLAMEHDSAKPIDVLESRDCCVDAIHGRLIACARCDNAGHRRLLLR